jgi:hypothetical protein
MNYNDADESESNYNEEENLVDSRVVKTVRNLKRIK